MSNSVAALRKNVEQLRIESKVKRIDISKASADLLNYCQEHANEDMLLTGVPASDNPFKDKKSCTIL